MMITYLNTCSMNHCRNAYKPNGLLLLLSSLVTRKLLAIEHWLLQNKALHIWNSLIQKSGFPKMHHYVRFLQIRSQMEKCNNIVTRIMFSYLLFTYKIISCNLTVYICWVMGKT